ncbi:sensor histidine kinase, partial [Streptomyces sp. SID1143]|uniref:sensor histidine kinase n=1 Tax=Streptomyces sp. SID1143 TaxID=3425889 RepID=UPI004057937D
LVPPASLVSPAAPAAAGRAAGEREDSRGEVPGDARGRNSAAADGSAYGTADGRAGGGAHRGHRPAGSPDAPSLAQLEVLVGQSRAAGMAVELSVEGAPDGACPPTVEQTAYRVVQEALTNVHKHAAGAATRVRVAHREAEVALQVENEPAADGAADAGLPSGGNGLVGMRERVTALGGGFVSGPTDAGGFRVSAIIPYARS